MPGKRERGGERGEADKEQQDTLDHKTAYWWSQCLLHGMERNCDSTVMEALVVHILLYCYHVCLPLPSSLEERGCSSGVSLSLEHVQTTTTSVHHDCHRHSWCHLPSCIHCLAIVSLSVKGDYTHLTHRDTQMYSMDTHQRRTNSHTCIHTPHPQPHSQPHPPTHTQATPHTHVHIHNTHAEELRLIQSMAVKSNSSSVSNAYMNYIITGHCIAP